MFGAAKILMLGGPIGFAVCPVICQMIKKPPIPIMTTNESATQNPFKDLLFPFDCVRFWVSELGSSNASARPI